MTRSEGSTPPVTGSGAELARRVAATSGLLVGLDFDGTLAPIVTDPDAARISKAARDPLADLVERDDVEVAIVSGRALADLADRVPREDVTLAGNHGLEFRRDGDRHVVDEAVEARDRLQRTRERLVAELAPVPGCRIEDKDLTLSVHVRETPDDRVDAVRSAVVDAVATTDALRLVEGKAVFEIRPAIDHDKGATMERLGREIPVDWLSCYVGDDTTDEDAFRAIQPEGVGVHVGAEDDTAAEYVLPDQSAVPPFLRWLASRPPLTPE